MAVGDVSDPVEPSQSTDREAEQRVGLGLLLRFIGAVFLVLLGGLLLLDRALGRANRHQASLDARSAALIAESYLGAQRVLLDRVADLVDGVSGIRRYPAFAGCRDAVAPEHLRCASSMGHEL